MRHLSILKIRIILGILIIPIEVFALTSYTPPNAHHRITLDGSLSEWKKDSVKNFGKSSKVLWDAVSVKDGLAGYFKALPEQNIKAQWSFTFYPNDLSSYSKMLLPMTKGEESSFYRIAGIDTLTAEWIIPWDSIFVDSSGSYRIGITGFSDRGDTLDALIISGRKFKEKNVVSWSKVYSKAALLVVLLVFLFVLQRNVRKNQARRRSGNDRSQARRKL